MMANHNDSSNNSDTKAPVVVVDAPHTAVAAPLLALQGVTNTSQLSSLSADASTDDASSLVLNFLDQLVKDQMSPATAVSTTISEQQQQQVQQAWLDWKLRFRDPTTSGVSTFLMAQNGAAKGGIQWGPTLNNLLKQEEPNLTASLAFCYAILLRWLTPSSPSERNGVYRGWLATPAPVEESSANDKDPSAVVMYADGLHYNLAQGWYEFQCHCEVDDSSAGAQQLSDWLARLAQPNAQQPGAYHNVIRAYLRSPEGGQVDNASLASSARLDTLVSAIATLYARMVAGDAPLDLLQEMQDQSGVFQTSGFATPCAMLADCPVSDSLLQVPLHFRRNPIPSHSQLLNGTIPACEMWHVVTSEVASVETIDLHTHLLPPTHGPLCLWGIDELLTYHYLVAEYFMTAPASLTPAAFYDMDKTKQAELIWQALFIDRSPISEACRGVVTTLVALGLQQEVQKRDLNSIRAFYKTFQDRGTEGAAEFSDLVFEKSGVKFNIMTNIPFNSTEAQYWRGPNKTDYDSQHFKSAVRVDPLLAGDRATIEFSLASAGYDLTLEGARQYLRDWCDTMKPEYVMASTPHDFVVTEETAPTRKNVNVNTAALSEPGAFVNVVKSQNAMDKGCDLTQDDLPSVINEDSDFLSQVLMKVCEERDLPLALKIGAHRAVNPQLKTAGDGVVAFADMAVLSRLCSRFPKVRFLATFLSRNNQHEACVLASKFRNLHIYGCWWFCNNPSMILEITTMRVEMLGTAFTAQHSDARVMDQLIYKWSHSRCVIARVLAAEYTKLAVSGWSPTRQEIRRDVHRLFGGSYEEFMEKSLLNLPN